MKVIFPAVIISLSVFLFSSKGKINPVSIKLSHPTPGYCTFQGLEIELQIPVHTILPPVF